MSATIHIAGAGLVGSLLARLLAARGYAVTVYERRQDPRKHGFAGGRSINLALSERGWKALEMAGMAEVIRAQALQMRGRMMHSVGGELTFQPYGKEGQAIYSVSRAGLNLALMDAAEALGAKFHFGQRVEEVNIDKQQLVMQDVQTGQQQTVQTGVLLSTDGAYSEVRNAMMRTPRFNYSQQYLDYAYKELNIPPRADGSHAMAHDVLHIWPRGAFMLIALPNPDGSFTATLFLPYEGTDSFANLQTDTAVTAFFQRYFPDTMPLITALTEDFRNNPTSHLMTVRCSPWHYGRNTLLLGDAAHAIVPFYGQGMNAGFEDCTLLCQMLDEQAGNWEEVIPAYSGRRVADGHAIADLALRNFLEMRDWVADPKFLLRKEIAASLHDRYPDFIPLYSMVTFSHIPYSKALAEAKAQDEVFEQILALEGIADNWRDNPEVTRIFEAWWAGRPR